MSGSGHGSVHVSEDDVRHVAALANLELTVEEVPRMQHDLNAVLGYIEQLNELDTTGIPAMAQVSEIQVSEIQLSEIRLGEVVGTEAHQHGESLRIDAVRPSVERDLVMASAPETDGRFFKVPKVIER